MNLRELLKAKRWNSSSLSKELGITRSAVGYWLKGITQPKTEYIKQIADLCEVNCSVVIDAILETKKQAQAV